VIEAGIRRAPPLVEDGPPEWENVECTGKPRRFSSHISCFSTPICQADGASHLAYESDAPFAYVQAADSTAADFRMHEYLLKEFLDSSNR
jgi:hypothetical protein